MILFTCFRQYLLSVSVDWYMKFKYQYFNASCRLQLQRNVVVK